MEILLITNVYSDSKIDLNSLESTKKAIVTINTRIALSAYKNVGSWTGTGFIVDKENMLIVTNNHIVGRASIGNYYITFYNGQQAEAKLVYYDLWQDYAILKVSEMPDSVKQISFTKSPSKQNQNVLVVGNTEAQEFSFHTGTISSLYEINGEMPQCSYVVNLNSAGGASGSPVLNDKNEAIGVLYGGGKTFAFVLNGSYVQYAIDQLKIGTVPARKHIGVITQLYSLDKAVKHRHFPSKEMAEYLKKFPDTRNRVVEVQSLIAGSPAENQLKPGDIIWEIDGKALAGSLMVLDDTMNKSTQDTVNLTIYRDGVKLNQTLRLYDVNQNKIQQMLNLAGAIFFQADDFTSSKTGIALNSVTVMNVQNGSSFSVIPVSFTQDDRNYYRLVINSIAENKVDSLETLIKLVPEITKHKFTNVTFKNYQPYFPKFQSDNAAFISSQDEIMVDITFDSIDTKPRLLKYDQQLQEWTANDM